VKYSSFTGIYFLKYQAGSIQKTPPAFGGAKVLKKVGKLPKSKRPN
jgi:hypothetical protein